MIVGVSSSIYPDTGCVHSGQDEQIGCIHTQRPGRPPRSPLGILRKLTRIPDIDKRLKRLCLIKKNENGYPRSVISRFTHRVGAETIQLIIDEKVTWLLRRSGVTDVDAVLDASFIKTWSIKPDRQPDGALIRMRVWQEREKLWTRVQDSLISGAEAYPAVGYAAGVGEREAYARVVVYSLCDEWLRKVESIQNDSDERVRVEFPIY